MAVWGWLQCRLQGRGADPWTLSASPPQLYLARALRVAAADERRPADRPKVQFCRPQGNRHSLYIYVVQYMWVCIHPHIQLTYLFSRLRDDDAQGLD